MPCENLVEIAGGTIQTVHLPGYLAEGMEDLIEWAEVIDGAKYANGEAVELRSAAAHLRLVIEHAEQEEMRAEVVRRLRFRSIAEVLATPELKAVADRCVDCLLYTSPSPRD